LLAGPDGFCAETETFTTEAQRHREIKAESRKQKGGVGVFPPSSFCLLVSVLSHGSRLIVRHSYDSTMLPSGRVGDEATRRRGTPCGCPGPLENSQGCAITWAPTRGAPTSVAKLLRRLSATACGCIIQHRAANTPRGVGAGPCACPWGVYRW